MVEVVDDSLGKTTDNSLTDDKNAAYSRAVRDSQFLKDARQNAFRRLLPSHRSASCRERTIMVPSLYKHKKTKRHSFKGLWVCGSAWLCYHCASKITERRRLELTDAIKVVRERHPEGFVGLLSLTHAHGRYDCPKVMRKAMSKAFDGFWRSRPIQKLKKDYGNIGYSKALEMTVGPNGWHPHYHVLVYFTKPVDDEEVMLMEELLKDLCLLLLKNSLVELVIFGMT